MDVDFDDILSALDNLGHQLSNDQESISRQQIQNGRKSDSPLRNKDDSGIVCDSKTRRKTEEVSSVFKDYTGIQSRSPCKKSIQKNVSSSKQSLTSSISASHSLVAKTPFKISKSSSEIKNGGYDANKHGGNDMAPSDVHCERLDVALYELSAMIGEVPDGGNPNYESMDNYNVSSTHHQQVTYPYDHLEMDKFHPSSFHIADSYPSPGMAQWKDDLCSSLEPLVLKSIQNDSAFDDSASILSSDGSRLSVGGSSGSSGSSSGSTGAEREARRGGACERRKEESDIQLLSCYTQTCAENPSYTQIHHNAVRIYSVDGDTLLVHIDEHSTVVDVVNTLLAGSADERSAASWALVEQLPHLYIERQLEDHSRLGEVLNSWPKDSENSLLIDERPEKYEIFNKPEVYLESFAETRRNFPNSPTFSERKKLIEDLLEPGHCLPEIDGMLYLKCEGKKTWKKMYFVLRASGIYYNPKSKTKAVMDLVCLQKLDQVELYTGVAWKTKLKAPTEYGFALKHPMLQKAVPKFIHYLCADDPLTMWKWIHSIRLTKYGPELYRSYLSIRPHNSRGQNCTTVSTSHNVTLECNTLKPLNIVESGDVIIHTQSTEISTQNFQSPNTSMSKISRSKVTEHDTISTSSSEMGISERSTCTLSTFQPNTTPTVPAMNWLLNSSATTKFDNETSNDRGEIWSGSQKILKICESNPESPDSDKDTMASVLKKAERRFGFGGSQPASPSRIRQRIENRNLSPPITIIDGQTLPPIPPLGPQVFHSIRVSQGDGNSSEYSSRVLHHAGIRRAASIGNKEFSKELSLDETSICLSVDNTNNADEHASKIYTGVGAMGQGEFLERMENGRTSRMLSRMEDRKVPQPLSKNVTGLAGMQRATSLPRTALFSVKTSETSGEIRRQPNSPTSSADEIRQIKPSSFRCNKLDEGRFLNRPNISRLISMEDQKGESFKFGLALEGSKIFRSDSLPDGDLSTCKGPVTMAGKNLVNPSHQKPVASKPNERKLHFQICNNSSETEANHSVSSFKRNVTSNDNRVDRTSKCNAGVTCNNIETSDISFLKNNLKPVKSNNSNADQSKQLSNNIGQSADVTQNSKISPNWPKAPSISSAKPRPPLPPKRDDLSGKSTNDSPKTSPKKSLLESGHCGENNSGTKEGNTKLNSNAVSATKDITKSFTNVQPNKMNTSLENSNSVNFKQSSISNCLTKNSNTAHQPVSKSTSHDNVPSCTMERSSTNELLAKFKELEMKTKKRDSSGTLSSDGEFSSGLPPPPLDLLTDSCDDDDAASTNGSPVTHRFPYKAKVAPPISPKKKPGFPIGLNS